MTTKGKHIIRLEQIPKANVFRTPEGYFNELPKMVESKIYSRSASPLNSIYTVPEGYFDTLSESILAKINPAEKIESLKTTNSIYPIPEGYFEELPYKIQKRISTPKKSLIPEWTLQPAFRYAVAAGFIIAILAIGIKQFMTEKIETVVENNKPVENFHLETYLATISKEEVRVYLEKEGKVELNQLMEYVSKDKKEKIKQEFNADLLDMNKIEIENIEEQLEFEDIDISEL